MGLVHASLGRAELDELSGHLAIGQVRYSTAGPPDLRNAQPLAVESRHGPVAIAHNGQLVNHARLRAELQARGAVFQSETDTETILHLLAASGGRSLAERTVEALRLVRGAYSLLVADERSLVAVRDPMGFRPLCLGLMPWSPDGPDGCCRHATVVASEPTAFDLLGAERLRDVEPGEVLTIDAEGARSSHPFAPRAPHACLFEFVYFARPDSLLDGTSVYAVRKGCGRRLACEQPVTGASREPTVVVAVPDTGLAAALGYAEQAGLGLEMGLVRSPYVGRTFIEPDDPLRQQGVKLKLNANSGALRGKRIVVVDDSIIRGTTSRRLVAMLRAAGATEVHVRIASPRTEWPCRYGIDTPTRDELLAARHDVRGIQNELGADSLGYLSLEGLLGAAREVRGSGSADAGYCHACFSGSYPLAPELGEGERERDDVRC